MIEAFRLGAVARGETLWEGLDLSFAEGEVWIVTGPPGCGKSLLLRILRGARRPEAGDVVVGGESLYRGRADAAAAFRARSGVVSESPLSPLETGAVPGSPGGARRRTVGGLFRLSAMATDGIAPREREQREEELLTLLGLIRMGGEADEAAPRVGVDPRPWEIASLSLSERTRAALAAELLRGPKFLFADMLLANAGKDWSEALGALLRALAREGTTVVLAERTVPSLWPGLKPVEGPPAVPFRLYRSGGPGSGGPAPPTPPPAGEEGEGPSFAGGGPSEEVPSPPEDEGDEAG